MKTAITEKDLPECAKLILKTVAGLKPVKHARTVGLSGNLGAGKTTFMKTLARAAGIKETVASPTFVLERVYRIPKRSLLRKRFTRLVHIDAYRLKGEDELKHVGWESLVSDPRNIIFIEWPERIKRLLPEDIITIRFRHAGEKKRSITW